MEGKWGFPIVRKQALDLDGIELIACSDVSSKDTKNLHKGVHFFVDDYLFENTYNHPENALKRYGKYRFLLSPDFSLYSEMNPWRQIESAGKTRWVAAKWQDAGKIVIPTVSWGSARSYEYFYGVNVKSKKDEAKRKERWECGKCAIFLSFFLVNICCYEYNRIVGF